jgi:hypothetical protein
LQQKNYIIIFVVYIGINIYNGTHQKKAMSLSIKLKPTNELLLVVLFQRSIYGRCTIQWHGQNWFYLTVDKSLACDGICIILYGRRQNLAIVFSTVFLVDVDQVPGGWE